MAGINAHQKINELAPFLLSRADAYIGVLIDDLTTKVTEEPYRMFTSRAEFRISLRQDNADLRLTPLGHQLGLASHECMQQVQKQKAATAQLLEALKTWKLTPTQVNAHLHRLGSSPLQEKQAAYQLLKRPELSWEILEAADGALGQYLQNYDQTVLEQVEIQLKYERYLQKEQELVEKTQRLEDYRLPADFDYDCVRALSAEATEKLKKIRPATLGQATRISGVSPADISVLMVYMGR